MTYLSPRYNFYAGNLLAFLIPLFPRAVPFAAVLWFATWVFEGGLPGKLSGLKSAKFLWLSAGFYLFHVAGMAWTRNPGSGFFDLEVKFSLLLFPFLFAAANPLYREKFHVPMLSFVAGSFTASLVCLGAAAYRTLVSGKSHFLYVDFSILHHPTYFAMYLAFAAAILLLLISLPGMAPTRLQRGAGLAMSGFFLAIIYLVSSKAGIISGFLMVSGVIALRMFLLRKWYPGVIWFLAVSVLFMVAIRLNARFKPVEGVISQGGRVTAGDPSTTETSALRVLVWETALEIIREHPVLGVGTGDVKDALLEKYSASGMNGALQRKLNAHDQFLETSVGLGIPGGILLLLLLTVPLAAALRSGNYFLVLFLGLNGFNFLFESMLNTQAGVVFFAFFYSYLLFVHPRTTP